MHNLRRLREKAVSFGAQLRIESVFDEVFLSVVGKESFIYRGITNSQKIPAHLLEKVVEKLESHDLKALNSCLKRIMASLRDYYLRI
ncbi:MAG: hypothetical protein GX111_05115 [Clostridiales bacterium]|nr:hypothetical protein [Clostridiales bacterium]